MCVHRLTTCTVTPATSPAQASEVLRSTDIRSTLGHWQTKVGNLNNILALEVEPTSADETRLVDACRRATHPALVARDFRLLQACKDYTPPRRAALYEWRTYTLYPGRVEDYMELLLEVLPVREKYSTNVCIWRPLTGDIDQLMHLWSYQSMEERDSFRALLHDESEWQRFTTAIVPMIRSMSSQFLTPI